MIRVKVSFGLVAALLLVALAGCKGKSSPSASAAGGEDRGEAVMLNGAGATFPYPLYSKWIAEYNRQHPDVRINYQSIGSGGGIRQVIAGTVDFGATDAPMTDEEAKKAPRKLLHIPATIGAVVVVYNVEGVTQALKLTPEILAAIYLGEIKNWNEPRIAELNPGLSLPDRAISAVYRSDGSGTTAVFSDYLAKVSPTWREKVGSGKSIRWPTGLGAKGNEGVTGQVKTTPGSIGYVELAYAKQNDLPIAAIKNKTGAFVAPTTEAITAAAKARALPDTLHVSLTDVEGEGVYPLSSYTYILTFQELESERKAQALAEFLWWAVHDGQKYAAELHYAPLPASAVARVEGVLKTLSAGGRQLLAPN